MKKIYILFCILLALVTGSSAYSQKTFNASSSNNWNTAANWTPSGVPAATDDVIIPDNLNVTVNTAAVCATLTINGGGNDNTITISAGQSLTVSGAITINAGTGSGGGGDDKIIAVGSATLNCGSISIAATTDDAIDSEITISTGTINVDGDITMNGTAARNAIRFTGAGTLNIGGNFSAGGDIIPGTASTVNYEGSSSQTVKADTYFNLTMSGGGTKNAAGVIDVNGTLTLTSGNLNTGANTITLINATDATQLSGGSSASYIISTGAGRLRREDLANSVTHNFPVGTSSHYLPVIVNPATGTTNDFSVNVFQGVTYNATDAGTSMNPKTGIVDAVWNVDRITGSGNATVTLNWNAGAVALEGTNFAVWPDSHIGISRYAGGWQVSTGTGNNSSNTASGTFGSFGPFGVGLSGAALPVKITSIKAFEKQNGIQVDWTADTEENLEKYEIERSSDGVSFTVIGQQIARNSSTESKYSYFDATPLPGVSFYRLRSVDFGATKSSYSSIVRVNLDKSDKEIVVYPNPVRSGTIAFQSSDLAKGNYTATVHNAGGQQVYSMRVSHTGGYINQTIYLPSSVRAGMYTLQLNKEGEKIMNRIFIVQ